MLKFRNQFTFVDQKIYRGCLSDSTNDRLMCDQSEKHQLGFCDTCSGSGCNNQTKMAKPKLSCLKCNDEKACAYHQYAQDAEPCQKIVLFGDKESCFTYHLNSKCIYLFIFLSKFKLSLMDSRILEFLLPVKTSFGETFLLVSSSKSSKCQFSANFLLFQLIRVFKDSTEVKRGCTLDVSGSDTKWCVEEDGCEKCSTHACNMKNVM